MSPMWDDEPERDAGACAACGSHTAEGIVRYLPRASGPDVRLIVHAHAQDCATKLPPAPNSRGGGPVPRSGHEPTTGGKT